MNNQWVRVVIAAVFEVGWVIGLKHSATFFHWSLTIIAIIISFTLMIQATKTLPVGTVYAVFVGLGTVGTVFMEIILFNEPIVVGKLLLIGVLLAGVIGLKMLTPKEEPV